MFLPSLALAAPLPDVDTPARGGARAPADAAVVIGVEDYGFVADVPFARRDADAFEGFLRTTRGLPADRVRRVADPDANREQILGAVHAMAGLVGPGGRLWVYYAGHGAAGPATGERLLLGDDAKTDPAAWRARAVGVTELGEAAGAAPVLLVLDACFNGQGRDGAELAPGTRYAVPAWAAAVGPRVTVWAATSPSELAGPLPAAAHGAFTYFALGALRGWADGEGGGPRDGVVTLAEANAYVLRALRARQAHQTPEVRGDGGLVLAEGATEPGPDLGALGPGAAPAASPFAVLDVPERVVTFRSEPPGAQVLVDGSPRCEAAPTCSRALPVGRHTVTFTLGRYAPHEVTLDVADAEPEPVVATLTPLFGTLDVVLEAAAPWAPGPGLRVRVDDDDLETPVRGHEVGYGTHRLRFDDPAWLPVAVEVEVGKGESKVVHLAVAPRLGGLKVVARDPADGDDVAADVVVDGRRVGRTPWAGALQVGRHVLVVGGERREVTVSEAVTEPVAFLVREAPRAGPSGWLFAGAGLAAAGAAVGLDTWALGAAGDARVAANTAGWAAAGLGGALCGVGVVDTLRADRPGRPGALGLGLVVGAAGASLGAATALQGAAEDDPAALRRLTVANTVGWSAAGAGAAVAASAAFSRGRATVGWGPGPGPGTLFVGGDW